jgi:subtilisin family serine protease
MHYPAAYQSVMSVAAVDHTGAIAGFSQRNTDVEIAAPGVAVLSTVPTGTMYEATLDVDGHGSFDAVPMDNFEIPAVPTGGPLVDCGLAETAADCGGAPAGFTCLIERGGFSFAQKAVSCEAAGGAAAVVFQSAGNAGPVYGTLGTTSVSIPVVGMDRDTGLHLLDNALDAVSLVNFTLTGYDYDYYNGTSMATPHVSAVAALVWSTHPACSNMEIRNALNATALDLGPSGQDHYFGNGLVQAQAASDYLDAHPCSGN